VGDMAPLEAGRPARYMIAARSLAACISKTFGSRGQGRATPRRRRNAPESARTLLDLSSAKAHPCSPSHDDKSPAICRAPEGA